MHVPFAPALGTCLAAIAVGVVILSALLLRASRRRAIENQEHDDPERRLARRGHLAAGLSFGIAALIALAILLLDTRAASNPGSTLWSALRDRVTDLEGLVPRIADYVSGLASEAPERRRRPELGASLTPAAPDGPPAPDASPSAPVVATREGIPVPPPAAIAASASEGSAIGRGGSPTNAETTATASRSIPAQPEAPPSRRPEPTMIRERDLLTAARLDWTATSQPPRQPVASPILPSTPSTTPTPPTTPTTPTTTPTPPTEEREHHQRPAHPAHPGHPNHPVAGPSPTEEPGHDEGKRPPVATAETPARAAEAGEAADRRDQQVVARVRPVVFPPAPPLDLSALHELRRTERKGLRGWFGKALGLDRPQRWADDTSLDADRLGGDTDPRGGVDPRVSDELGPIGSRGDRVDAGAGRPGGPPDRAEGGGVRGDRVEKIDKIDKAVRDGRLDSGGKIGRGRR